MKPLRVTSIPGLQPSFARLQAARKEMFDACRAALPEGTAVLAQLKANEAARRVIVVGRSSDGAMVDVKPQGAVLASRVNLERIQLLPPVGLR